MARYVPAFVALCIIIAKAQRIYAKIAA